jgi:protein ImuA
MALRALSAVFEDVSDFGSAVWRADALARHASPSGVVATGHALLDAELPGGGWPVGALCEILQTHSAQSEWRLLLPALCAAQRQGTSQVGKPGTEAGQAQALHTGSRGATSQYSAACWVALIGPPHVPFGPALAACGLDVQQLLWVKASTPAERLWAAEQALRCAGVAAVLAWLPQVQAASLRRLQMAALAHAKLFFVMRPAAAQQESSPAVLRLLLLAQEAAGGEKACAALEALHIQVLKRRGPPLAQVLSLSVRVMSEWEPCHALDSLAA